MGRYLVQRLITSIPLLLGISLILFGLIHLAPGGPMAAYAFVPNLTQDQVEAIKDSLGLNDPLYVQYLKWLQGVLTGDWGYSYTDGRPVAEIIFERLPNTLQLTGASFIIAIGIGIPIGIFTATRAGKTVRYGVNFVTMGAVSMPTFWVGLMVILIFAGELRLIPSGGMKSIGEPFSITDRLRHLIAPAIVLATARLASFSRYTHSSMVEVMLEDFIRTARAKGLSERVVVFRHGLRNVMITLVTLMGLLLPALFSGALITEAIFAWPGNGRLLVDSLVRRDYLLVMVNFRVIALLVVMGNFLADLAYGILDPRIRYD